MSRLSHPNTRGGLPRFNRHTPLGEWTPKIEHTIESGDPTKPLTNTTPASREPAPAPDPKITRQPNAREAEWQQTTTKLAGSLAALEAGHRLILETREADPYYVQFAADGAAGYRAEAVSNRFLQGWKRLDTIAENRLRRLGWRPPTDIGDGPVNWWLEFRAGTPTERMAELTITTLRKVYEVPRPVALVHWAFARSGGEILLPTLGIERRAKTPILEQRVEAALCEFLEADEVVRDEDGDWPVRSDDVMVYLRAVSEPAHVTVFSPVLFGITPSPALLDAVNDINGHIRVARAVVGDSEVILSAEVYDQPHIEDSVIHAFKAVSSLANEISGDLQSRFGGSTQFGRPPDPAPQPMSELGYGGYL